MGKWIAGIAAVMLCTSAAAETTYIKAGSLFDSRSGDVIRDAVIVVEDEMIAAVGDSDTNIPAGAQVIDLSSSFVLPGVMDMHTHVIGNLDKFFFAGYFQSPHRATIGGVMAASFGDTWSPQLYEFFESIDLYNRIDSFMPYFPLVPFYPLILMVLGTYLIVKSRS